jgi:hypothetical protein
VTPYAQQVDRDRRALARLLLEHVSRTFATAADHAYHAAKMGHDPVPAAADVILGNADLKLDGLAPRMARIMYAAYRSGWRRAGLAAGLPLSHPYYAVTPSVLTLDSAQRPDVRSKARRFLAIARESAGKAVVAVTRGLRRLLGLGGKDRAAEARRAVLDAGYGPGGKVAETVAETAVQLAYAAGQRDGFDAEAGEDVIGFRFVATLDKATTKYCRPLDGVKVLKNDPWLERNGACPRHYNCRSVIVPLTRPFTPTVNPPEVPAMAGFGLAYA